VQFCLWLCVFTSACASTDQLFIDPPRSPARVDVVRIGLIVKRIEGISDEGSTILVEPLDDEAAYQGSGVMPTGRYRLTVTDEGASGPVKEKIIERTGLKTASALSHMAFLPGQYTFTFALHYMPTPKGPWEGSEAVDVPVRLEPGVDYECGWESEGPYRRTRTYEAWVSDGPGRMKFVGMRTVAAGWRPYIRAE
jgi:hypothetical protein